MTMYRERETERERQECIYSLPLAYTNKNTRKRSLSLSLSLVSRTSAHKLIPLSFIIDRYIPFVASKRTRERSILHSLRLLFTRAPSARYCALPPPSSAHLSLPRPYLLAIVRPIFSICPVSARYRHASSSAKSRQPMPYILHPVSRYTSNAFHRT